MRIFLMILLALAMSGCGQKNETTTVETSMAQLIESLQATQADAIMVYAISPSLQSYEAKKLNLSSPSWSKDFKNAPDWHFSVLLWAGNQNKMLDKTLRCGHAGPISLSGTNTNLSIVVNQIECSNPYFMNNQYPNAGFNFQNNVLKKTQIRWCDIVADAAMVAAVNNFSNTDNTAAHDFSSDLDNPDLINNFDANCSANFKPDEQFSVQVILPEYSWNGATSNQNVDSLYSGGVASCYPLSKLSNPSALQTQALNLRLPMLGNLHSALPVIMRAFENQNCAGSPDKSIVFSHGLGGALPGVGQFYGQGTNQEGMVAKLISQGNQNLLLLGDVLEDLNIPTPLTLDSISVHGVTFVGGIHIPITINSNFAQPAPSESSSYITIKIKELYSYNSSGYERINPYEFRYTFNVNDICTTVGPGEHSIIIENNHINSSNFYNLNGELINIFNIPTNSFVGTVLYCSGS